MQQHQRALLDQAIRAAATCFDEQHGLLHRQDDRRYLLVQESLAYAAMLLIRASAERSRDDLSRARKLIDAVLARQQTNRSAADCGAFPLVWTPARQAPAMLDPESREFVGTLLASILRDHPVLLGEARAERLKSAIGLTLRAKDAPLPASTAAQRMAAWLDVEFGDPWRGERDATDVVFRGFEALAAVRFGDARAIAQELWALSLWRRNERLHQGVDDMIDGLLADVQSAVHTTLPAVFGALTGWPAPLAHSYPWLGSWLTWYALGATPLMPRTLSDPVQATLFAYPMVSKLKLDPNKVGELDPLAECPLERCHNELEFSGWREAGLHIEARRGSIGERGKAPLAGARWLTAEGGSAWLTCRVSKREAAVCRKRFVHLDDPGLIVVNIHDLGPGQTRMIDNGWWLSGLHFATEGFQMTEARRSEDGLELRFRPTAGETLLLFSPLA